VLTEMAIYDEDLTHLEFDAFGFDL
jgi:hypothetical protein